MEELIAKRYVKALKLALGSSSLESICEVFYALAKSYNDKKFISIVANPNISKKDKSDLLLLALKGIESDIIKNFIKLLIENNRVLLLPTIAKVIKKDIAQTAKEFSGFVYSNSDVKDNLVDELSKALTSKFNSNISLSYKKDSFDGIKVDIEDLGAEISFSKSRINTQLLDHITKAI